MSKGKKKQNTIRKSQIKIEVPARASQLSTAVSPIEMIIAPSAKQAERKLSKKILQVVVMSVLTAYYLGGSAKLFFVTLRYTSSLPVAILGSALLITVSVAALFDLKSRPRYREIVIWAVKLTDAFLFAKDSSGPDNWACFLLLVLFDALAHILIDFLG